MSAIQDLDINLNKKELITLVGAGGKTTTMFGLARELKNHGAKVLVTTTTAIYYPKENEYDDIIVACDINSGSFGRLSASKIYVAGSFVNTEGKLIGFTGDKVDEIYRQGIFDYILVEGDGSKKRSIKAPAEHEPVIPKLSTKIVGLIGMDVLGKEINGENVHRPELFCTIAKCKYGDLINCEQIILLIKSGAGLFKNTPETAKKYLKLNKVSHELNDEAIELIKAGVLNCDSGIEKIIIETIYFV